MTREQWLKVPRPVRAVLALLVETLVYLRYWAYKGRFLKTYQVAKPVISVGNLSAGGSGKTPIVDCILTQCEQNGLKAALLTRGYQRKSFSQIQIYHPLSQPWLTPKIIGDEPFLLGQKHPQTPIGIASKRMMGATALLQSHAFDLFIADDAYQHLSLHRDLNLLCIDALEGLDNGWVMPLGSLREPEHKWRRADAILVTKVNLGFKDKIKHDLKHRLGVNIPIFCFPYYATSLRNLNDGRTIQLQELAQKKALISCGIAQPSNFEKSVLSLGITVRHHFYFADHQEYDLILMSKLESAWNNLKNDCDYWITTEKDAVKIQALGFRHADLWTLTMAMSPPDDWQEFLIDFLHKKGLK